MATEIIRKVFVPSTGYLYFYLAEKKFKQKGIAFSSPLRGIYISTLFEIIIYHTGQCFRPLYGVSLFLPLTNKEYNGTICFRPLYGVSLFLPLPRIPLENSKGIIWFAVQTHKPDNFMFISTCPELKMLYFTGIGAKS